MQLYAAIISLVSLSRFAWAQDKFGQGTSSSPVPTYLVHQYPNDTWLENLAVRSNGQILATQASSPKLYSIDPTTGVSQLVYQFPNATGAMGITETTPDVFYVILGNFSLATFEGVVGTFSLWKVDYSTQNAKAPSVSKYIDLPEPKWLDGLITLNASRGLLLGADINLGNVIRVDLVKKTSTVAISDQLMAPGPPSFPLAVNGIKIRNSTLYFTNTGQSIIGKVPIDSNGDATGNASVVFPIDSDDFIFDTHGDILTTTMHNITEIFAPGLKTAQNLTGLASPTAVQFGRMANDMGCLYATTTGGDFDYALNPVPVGGAIYALDVFRNGSCPIVRSSWAAGAEGR